MVDPDRDSELIVVDAVAWRAWLAVHDQDSDGVWLVLAKKGTTDPTSLTYGQALEESLCHGWIDGQKGSRDERTFRQRFSPRRARSGWSKRNVGIVTELLAAGRMLPVGLAEIERAKSDGRWQAAYDGPARIAVPDDLAAALDADPRAAAMFAVLTSQNRYAILYRLQTTKQASTRVRKVQQFVEMLARGETIYPQARTVSE